MNLITYFKALSDKTRLRLINLLLNYELNVNEIASILEMGQPRVSRHLKVLLDTGLVTYRRDGLWVFYSVIGDSEGRTLINSIKSYLADDKELKSDIEQCKTIIENRTKDTIKFFDSIAGDWTKLKGNIIGNFDINGLIARYMKKCKLAVDIGCGNGDLMPQLLKFAEKVVGVDRSQKMLEYARRLISENAYRISFRLGEAEYLPLSNNEADFALANMVLHHLSSPLKAIKEIHRVLKRHGSLIIIDLLKHNNELMRTKYGDRWLGFNEEDITKWLINTNFSVKEKVKFEIQHKLKLILYLSIKQ